MASASKTKRNVLTVLVIIQAIVFLVPVTCLYVVFVLLSVGSGLRGTGLIDIAILLSGCYGLASLWWLVVTHRVTSFAKISPFIWGGVGCGSLLAFYFLYRSRSTMGRLLEAVRALDMASVLDILFRDAVLMCTICPLLLVLTLLFVIPKQRHQELSDFPVQER